MQAARPFDFAQGRLYHRRDYFGAREATIFSKHGSPCNGYFLSFGIFR